MKARRKQPCHDFQRGNCTRGARCRFKHVQTQEQIAAKLTPVGRGLQPPPPPPPPPPSRPDAAVKNEASISKKAENRRAAKALRNKLLGKADTPGIPSGKEEHAATSSGSTATQAVGREDELWIGGCESVEGAEEPVDIVRCSESVDEVVPG